MQTEQEKLKEKKEEWNIKDALIRLIEVIQRTRPGQVTHECAHIEAEFKKALASQKQKMGEMISTIDTKAHACLFNDGEQNCDCYLEALSDIKQRINEL